MFPENSRDQRARRRGEPGYAAKADSGLASRGLQVTNLDKESFRKATERFVTNYQFRSLLAQEGACDIVMFDVNYVGGITEGKKIAAMTHAWHLPVTTHNCGSPVLTHVCAHLLYSSPNTALMETVRSFYKTYGDAITDTKVYIGDDYIHLSDKPGLGIDLREDVLKAKDTIHVETKAVRSDQMFAVNGDPRAQSPGDDKLA
jgi:L-alanine-DL-glutamate epimerase and related enzymes of enolase superfamily